MILLRVVETILLKTFCREKKPNRIKKNNIFYILQYTYIYNQD